MVISPVLCGRASSAPRGALPRGRGSGAVQEAAGGVCVGLGSRRGRRRVRGRRRRRRGAPVWVYVQGCGLWPAGRGPGGCGHVNRGRWVVTATRGRRAPSRQVSSAVRGHWGPSRPPLYAPSRTPLASPPRGGY
ncbi:hypothetical protein OBBRIDRAFT_618458 [Obba rivulosa]|uniref:Uncharacterized protein n=1 Tax=Obba rivulosa TaxID=1052685 RepID=A0A8E2J5X5_9APHY|nr:hypothetical protein OBBRIDRAFT_618458 [Obba rivulosa]